MKPITQPTSNFRPWSLALLITLIPLIAPARPPIERLQRELQARFHYFTGGNYLLWPSCRSGNAAPFYPPDGFYGNLDSDPYFACYVLGDLCLQFYGVYYPFY